MRKLLVTAALIGAVTMMGATPALAGEITGNGKPTPVADFWTSDTAPKSICAFSGLNDTWNGETPDEEGFSRTQNWGQLPKALRDQVRAGNSPAPGHLEAPNVACNPSGSVRAG